MYSTFGYGIAGRLYSSDCHVFGLIFSYSSQEDIRILFRNVSHNM